MLAKTRNARAEKTGFLTKNKRIKTWERLIGTVAFTIG